jgi:hypothetical protein
MAKLALPSGRAAVTSLGFACAVLAVLALKEFTAPPAAVQSAPGAGASIEPGGPKDSSRAQTFVLPSLQRFSVVTERPLFSPSRRPALQTRDNSGAWSSFVLAGIIITPQSREALILHGKPPAIAHLQEGQSIDGWTVASIEADRVVFRDSVSEHELKLIDKGPTGPSSLPQGRPAGK